LCEETNHNLNRLLDKPAGFGVVIWSIENMKVKDLIKGLKEDGWFLVKTKGSHRQFKHPSKSGKVTVAGKPNVEVPPGTLNAALKQAGLKK
jgi:predicted RNA binding protein YcfA (HicA-like mRNA interferase family)